MKLLLCSVLALLASSASVTHAQQLMVPSGTDIVIFDALTGVVLDPSFIDLAGVGSQPLECIAGSGAYYVSDLGERKVFKFSQDGTTLLAEVSVDPDILRGMEFADGKLYVCTRGPSIFSTGEVRMYDPNLAPLGSFVAGSWPEDVLDVGGHLLVSDYGVQGRLGYVGQLAFHAYDGAPLGILVPNVIEPRQLAHNPAGGVAVCTGQFPASYVRQYSNLGTLLNSFSFFDTVHDQHVLADGTMIIVQDLAEVYRWDPATGASTNYGFYGSGYLSVYLDSALSAFCPGDGSGGMCPCGNSSAAGSGEGCTNGTGSGALLEGSGFASVVADSLLLTVSHAAPNEIGIFVQNITTSAPAVFYNGLLCLPADQHIVRHYAPPAVQPTFTDATGMGANAQAMSLGDFLGDTQPGVTVHYQFWYRDNHGPCGQGANISSGLSVTWL